MDKSAEGGRLPALAEHELSPEDDPLPEDDLPAEDEHRASSVERRA